MSHDSRIFDSKPRPRESPSLSKWIAFLSIMWNLHEFPRIVMDFHPYQSRHRGHGALKVTVKGEKVSTIGPGQVVGLQLDSPMQGSRMRMVSDAWWIWMWL